MIVFNKSVATLVDSMGDDRTVANAARVSFSKYVHEFSDKDAKLLNYLAKHSHWTPFAHIQATFHIKAPVFVARQLIKHQIGLVWNEVSRRYVDTEPEYYLPLDWRKRSDNAKQGSSLEMVEGPSKYSADYAFFAVCEGANEAYKRLLNEGVCPEQARMVLPLNHATEWYWTGSVAAFARVVKQRTEAHAQRETAEVALQISESLSEEFPVSWKALMEN